MDTRELKNNLPHLIALMVLAFALLIVSTNAGLTRCSDFGNSYCDVYYSIVGTPKVMILQNPEGGGLGYPVKMKRLLEDEHGLPTRMQNIGDLSPGMLEGYDVVVVEKARKIPTRKLEIIKDYVYGDMGRLIWVGDSGTVGGEKDKTCKTIEYSIKYMKRDKGSEVNEEKKLCVSEPSKQNVSASIASKTKDLTSEAMTELKKVCEESFGGTLASVRTDQGYQCKNPSGEYSKVYINWKNEKSVKRIVDPWNRGEYSLLGSEEKHEGLDFGTKILGISFIADNYAVSEYSDLSESVSKIRTLLLDAHSGFVECEKNLAQETCSPQQKLSVAKQKLNMLKDNKQDAENDLSVILTNLESIKQTKNTSSIQVEDAINIVTEKKNELETKDVGEEPSEQTLSQLEKCNSTLNKAVTKLENLKALETKEEYKQQYEEMASKIRGKIVTEDLEKAIEEYKECSAQGPTNLKTELAEATGNKEMTELLISYSSPHTDKKGTIEFIKNAPETDEFQEEVEESSYICGEENQEIEQGFKAAGQALKKARESKDKLAPEMKSKSLATLTAADEQHPLIQGISKSIELKKKVTGGEEAPVPFVLVYSAHQHTHVVSKVKITPEYKGEDKWPAITVKDPRFASHVFGRGTMVYYAFPPETDEIFVDNLVRFILY